MQLTVLGDRLELDGQHVADLAPGVDLDYGLREAFLSALDSGLNLDAEALEALEALEDDVRKFLFDLGRAGADLVALVDTYFDDWPDLAAAYREGSDV